MKADTPEKCRIVADNCLYGRAVPNAAGGEKYDDIFWLMGWADWEIEARLMEADDDEG